MAKAVHLWVRIPLGGVVSETKARRWLGICVLAAAVSTPFWPMQGLSQGEAPSRKEAFGDLLWALLNSREFLFSH